MPSENGITLTDLLDRVNATIKRGMPESYWVHADILKADKRNYWSLELSGADAGGKKSKVRAMIWGTNVKIVSKFEKATGSTLKSGLRILFQCTVQFHPEYGISLAITDIDPRFTMGDMEAKLQAIRNRLAVLKETNVNKNLKNPNEFCRIAVIAPNEAAGLGDFKSKADRLGAHSLCQFDYFTALFQGDRAEETIIGAMHEIITRHKSGTFYDALVIIRGGGDKAGLYQLNEIRLARGVCRSPIPVFVGIGHERDTTILDEVANQRFPTPSLVITHIERTIIQNANSARTNMLLLQKATKSILENARNNASDLNNSISHHAHQKLAISKQSIEKAHQSVRHNASISVQKAKHDVLQLKQASDKSAIQSVGQARRYVEHELEAIKRHAPGVLGKAKDIAGIQHQNLKVSAHQLITRARAETESSHANMMIAAKNATKQAKNDVARLIEQIVLRDPKEILTRGFALVKNEHGEIVTNLSKIEEKQTITIQFNDGHAVANVKEIHHDR